MSKAENKDSETVVTEVSATSPLVGSLAGSLLMGLSLFSKSKTNTSNVSKIEKNDVDTNSLLPSIKNRMKNAEK